MAEIRLEKTLAAPIEHVFERLADHENYSRFRGITASKLTRAGEAERNGQGAMRAISTGPIRFSEEITAFERPTRLDYLIHEVNLPLDHDGGSITLGPAGEESTRVVWVSTFTATTPILSGAAGALMAVVVKRGFASMLDDVERLYVRP